MKRTATVFGFLMVCTATNGQDHHTLDSIRGEGALLYRLEMAAWQATDLLLRKQKEYRTNISGYFSYEQGRQVHAVFFSSPSDPQVIAMVSFDSSLNAATARVDTRKRSFTHHEGRLYQIRKQTLGQLKTDPLFSHYENTTFNLIPLADSVHGKVYVITQPEVNGVVIFGNDYQLLFNARDSLLHKRALHAAMIPVDFGKDSDPELIETFHVHSKESGRYITPTDICTLMLYQRFAKWKQHLVMSKTHVCAWDLAGNALLVQTMDEWTRENNNKKLVGVGF